MVPVKSSRYFQKYILLNKLLTDFVTKSFWKIGEIYFGKGLP